MDIVVSGVRPTGKQHLGNYFGAIINFVKLQNEIPSFFFIADYHSLTTHPTPADLKANVRQILIEYLACGLDPDKSALYVQSDLPQIPEMYLIFNMMAYKGELERSVTFKDKARMQPDNINAGLLTYPVLMAVDIIIHRATKVPVGKDQSQHLEMTRTFASRFNHMYQTDYFPEPVGFNYSKELVKIPSLDGTGKMSKSDNENSAIFLADEPDLIRKKVKRAVTDGGPEKPNQEMAEPVSNLFKLLEIAATKDKYDHFLQQYNNCSIRYGDLKKEIAEDLIVLTAPIRSRIKELTSDQKYLDKVTSDGAEKARESAAKTLKEVRRMIGLNYFV